MKQFAFVLTLVACTGLTAYAQKGTAFKLECDKLPFEAIKGPSRNIDKQCGINGDLASNFSPVAKQNIAKNNFCAQGKPIKIAFETFDQLQKAAEDKNIPFHKKGLPPNRAVLKDLLKIAGGKSLGEGVIVTLEGFVIDARHSNSKFFVDSNGKPEDGENVNCNSGEIEDNDIHIELAASASLLAPKDRCQGVTAEISPHFRPLAWDRFDVNAKTMAAAHGIAELKGAKVRITGPLFFDASHAPSTCAAPVPGQPARRSIWEIHPAYAIDVFDAKTKKFVPLDQWAKDK